MSAATAHTVRRLTSLALLLAGWFWGIAVTLVLAATVVVWAVNGTVDVSVAVYARQASIWFPFSQAILVVSVFLRVHVASGMTRRTFVRASLLVSSATGFGYAVVLTALVLVERRLHALVGWDAAMHEVQIADESSSVGVLLLDLAVPFVVANLSGLLVGVAYQRLGGWVGTLVLPLTAGPVLLTQYLAGAGVADLPGVWTTTDAGHLALAVGAGAVMAVLTAALYARTTHRLPLSATA